MAFLRVAVPFRHDAFAFRAGADTLACACPPPRTSTFRSCADGAFHVWRRLTPLTLPAFCITYKHRGDHKRTRYCAGERARTAARARLAGTTLFPPHHHTSTPIHNFTARTCRIRRFGSTRLLRTDRRSLRAAAHTRPYARLQNCHFADPLFLRMPLQPSRLFAIRAATHSAAVAHAGTWF